MTPRKMPSRRVDVIAAVSATASALSAIAACLAAGFTFWQAHISAAAARDAALASMRAQACATMVSDFDQFEFEVHTFIDRYQDNAVERPGEASAKPIFVTYNALL